jgi:hypothetical protein
MHFQVSLEEYKASKRLGQGEKQGGRQGDKGRLLLHSKGREVKKRALSLVSDSIFPNIQNK